MYIECFKLMNVSQNMANAEEDLYAKWKEMTLNSGGEETKQISGFYENILLIFKYLDIVCGIIR